MLVYHYRERLCQPGGPSVRIPPQPDLRTHTSSAMMLTRLGSLRSTLPPMLCMVLRETPVGDRDHCDLPA